MARRKALVPTTSAGRIQAKVEAKTSAGTPTDRRFWLHDEPHRTVFADAERIAQVTRARRMQDFYHACLYDDDELATLAGGASMQTFAPQTLSSNIVKRQVDTFVSKIAKNRPVPMGLTTGGNYGEQRRAKTLSKIFAGVLDQVDYWTTREARLRDGAIFGDGFAYNYRVGRQLHHDRIFPWELEVDPREAQYGKPLTVRFRRYVDKVLLQERYPSMAEEIEQSEAKLSDDRFGIGWDETCDMRLLRGVWRLPSEEGGAGHFALCTSEATLELKEYRRPGIPFSRFQFLPPLIGWRGQGMVKSLTGLQYEVNAIGMRLQEQGYMTGSYVFIEDGSGIETDTIDNGALTIVRHRGGKPEFHTPAPWHPAFFDYYLNLRGRFPAEESRISELSSRGEIPGGLESGKAIRTYHDIETEGFVPQGRSDERDVISTCWQHFDLLEEIHAEEPEEKDERKPYVVQVEDRKHGRTTLTPTDYAEVRLDREKFTLRVFPTSFLSGTPEDQIATVKELTSSGFLSQDEALALLDFPDVERILTLRNSARRNIERLLEALREADDPETVYEVPEPAWNLELCKALALMSYLEAKLDGVPEPNLRKILQFATDAQDALTAAAATSKDSAAAANVDMNAGEGQPAPDPDAQFLPPDEQLAPANAAAPDAMALLPGAP